jgi:hypothetical protein
MTSVQSVWLHNETIAEGCSIYFRRRSDAAAASLELERVGLMPDSFILSMIPGTAHEIRWDRTLADDEVERVKAAIQQAGLTKWMRFRQSRK